VEIYPASQLGQIPTTVDGVALGTIEFAMPAVGFLIGLESRFPGFDAAGMFDNGADIVYAAAGGSGGGVFEAAKAANGLAIGVDSDQYKTADPSVQSVIMTSMLKKVDVAVFDFISSVNDGKFAAGQKIYDLKAGGVGYATSGGKIDDIAAKLEAYKAKIISGAITVPTK